MKLHELNIKLTKGQILKILNDEPFEVMHKHLGHGRHVLHLKKSNLDKLKMGNKIKLSSDEKENTIEGNGGFNKFFKNVGHALKNTFTNKNIESDLIHQGIPIAGNVLGTVLGGPAAGYAGAVIGNQIADEVGKKTGRGMRIIHKKGSMAAKEKMEKLRAMRGKGLFQTLRKVGIHRKDVERVAKNVGKKAAHIGVDTLSSAANAYGVPVPEEFKDIAKHNIDRLIDSHPKHHNVHNKIQEYDERLPENNEISTERLQHHVDRMPAEAQPFVQQQMNSMGFGLKNKYLRIIKGGNVKITRRPKKLYAESQNTFSPYANSNSPQMNPYQPTINSYTHPVPLYGSGLYGLGLYN